MFGGLIAAIPYAGTTLSAIYASPWVFAAANSVKLGRTLCQVYNTTSPTQIAKNITLTLMDCCLHPHTKYPLLCLGVIGTAGAACTDPTGALLAGAEYIGDKLIKDCVGLK